MSGGGYQPVEAGKLPPPPEPAVTAPVIFLDIDGVLNSQRSCAAYKGFPWPAWGESKKGRDWDKFDDVAVQLLRRAVERTGAVCVLSSTWRVGIDDAGVADLSARLGVPIVALTRKTLGREIRGEQIRDWLAENPSVKVWAILDDDSDMLPDQKARFVKVDFRAGLSYQNYLDLVVLLGGKP